MEEDVAVAIISAMVRKFGTTEERHREVLLTAEEVEAAIGANLKIEQTASGGMALQLYTAESAPPPSPLRDDAILALDSKELEDKILGD